jgi:hypothetical protein
MARFTEAEKAVVWDRWPEGVASAFLLCSEPRQGFRFGWGVGLLPDSMDGNNSEGSAPSKLRSHFGVLTSHFGVLMRLCW